MSSNDWAEQFKNRIKAKEIAKQESKKNFNTYQQSVLKLFDFIESKIKGIDCIHAVRYLVSQSEVTTVQIKALKLQCLEKFLEFVPEGINLDNSKGTIRLRHNTRALSQFIYLHLIVDPNATQQNYSENLIWVINQEGSENFNTLPRFDAEILERLVELTFLE